MHCRLNLAVSGRTVRGCERALDQPLRRRRRAARDRYFLLREPQVFASLSHGFPKSLPVLHRHVAKDARYLGTGLARL
jgi:hypothetical protein